jgi:hypothetical protein
MGSIGLPPPNCSKRCAQDNHYPSALDRHIQQQGLGSPERLVYALAQFVGPGHPLSFHAKRAGQADEIHLRLDQVHPQVLFLDHVR